MTICQVLLGNLKKYSRDTAGPQCREYNVLSKLIELMGPHLYSQAAED